MPTLTGWLDYFVTKAWKNVTTKIKNLGKYGKCLEEYILVVFIGYDGILFGPSQPTVLNIKVFEVSQ